MRFHLKHRCSNCRRFKTVHNKLCSFIFYLCNSSYSGAGGGSSIRIRFPPGRTIMWIYAYKFICLCIYLFCFSFMRRRLGKNYQGWLQFAKDHQYYYILKSIYRKYCYQRQGWHIIYKNIEYFYRCIEVNWRLLLSRAKTNQNKTNPEKIRNKSG